MEDESKIRKLIWERRDAVEAFKYGKRKALRALKEVLVRHPELSPKD